MSVKPPLLVFDTNLLLRTARKQRAGLSSVSELANQMGRSALLSVAAETLKVTANAASETLDSISTTLDSTIRTLRKTARVEPHTIDVHLAGDLRYIGGHPPDGIRQGVQDCRIFEAVLAIARADQDEVRKMKVLLTRDSDFLEQSLIAELDALGFTLTEQVGRVYGECR